ncbi:MAG: ABC transporter [Desulfobacteraceae bacterium 4572_123]|nr:MAG: ABC transporter [Desulfobacteraceae bacterium 4572_123]
MIHIENLTKNYHKFCAVDHITFDVRKGEILGLLGPNGAGKTTTLRMLTGFLTPTDGRIRVGEYTVADDPLPVKQMMGYLPESAPLYPDMLVFDYLTYVAGIRKLDSRQRNPRIKALADLCGLTSVMHRPIGTLSKGYRQRVGLAHAMMSDPEILVLDEPTSGLDPNQIVEIRDIIRRIGKEKTIIFSTHILSEAEATCDRVVIINKGRVVADDRMAALKASAGRDRVIHLTLENADGPALRQVLAQVRGIGRLTRVEETDSGVCASLTSDGDTDIRGDIYRRIRQTDWVLIEFYQETQTLETIFRQLTREN